MNCIPSKSGRAVLCAACLALGSMPAAAQNANAGSTDGCSCFNPSALKRIYATELRMRPMLDSSRHCAIAPTFLDIEQSVIVTRKRRVAPDQRFARNVVSMEPEVKIAAQFQIYIDSNPLKPMGSCEIKTTVGGATTRNVKIPISHQEAAACMSEIQASKVWKQLCVGDVLKSQ